MPVLLLTLLQESTAAISAITLCYAHHYFHLKKLQLTSSSSPALHSSCTSPQPFYIPPAAPGYARQICLRPHFILFEFFPPFSSSPFLFPYPSLPLLPCPYCHSHKHLLFFPIQQPLNSHLRLSHPLPLHPPPPRLTLLLELLSSIPTFVTPKPSEFTPHRSQLVFVISYSNVGLADPPQFFQNASQVRLYLFSVFQPVA